MDNAQAIFFAQFDDTSGKFYIVDATTELTIECVNRNLAQWIIVDVLHCPAELLTIEQRPFHCISVPLQPFVSAEPRP